MTQRDSQSKNINSSDGLFKTLTTEEFILKAIEVHGNTFDYSRVVYEKSKQKVEIVCPLHGAFLQIPNSHLMGRGCKKCSRHRASIKNTISFDEFEEKALHTHGDYYVYDRDSYTGTSDHIVITCPVHGEFMQKGIEHIRGKGCYICGQEKRFKSKTKDTNWFLEKAKCVHGDLYEYNQVDYKKIKEKVKIECTKHGEFAQTPQLHLNGGGCPKCRSSKGEKKIRNYFNECGMIFEEQKTFDGCIDKRSLKFDFFINNKLIEFQGIQHYISIDHFGGEDALLGRQKKDQIKRDFCEENNIPLLEIRYDDKNWKRKMQKFLKI